MMISINRHLLRHVLAISTSLLVSSCFFGKKEEKFTVVEGTVINKYTTQAVAGAPVSVHRFEYRLFGHPKIDFVTTASTDAAGRYALSFTTDGKNTYRIKVSNDTTLHDLTTYPEYEDYQYGVKTQAGTTNKINFKVTPFKAVAVTMQSSKEGKTDIAFRFESTDGKAYYGGTIFFDTIKANQRISLVKTIKVLPNRRYLFTKQTSNRVRLGLYTYTFQDYINTNQTREIGYNDSVAISFK